MYDLGTPTESATLFSSPGSHVKFPEEEIKYIGNLLNNTPTFCGVEMLLDESKILDQAAVESSEKSLVSIWEELYKEESE